MAKKGGSRSVIVYAVAAILVVWLFAFGGVGFIQGLFVQPSPGGPGGEVFTATIQSVADGGVAVSVLVSSEHQANIVDTAANLVGEVTVDITLVITNVAPEGSPTTNRVFTLTIEVPSYNSNSGTTFKLTDFDLSSPYCPTITYTITSTSGSGSAQPDCSFRGVVQTNGAMTLKLSLTMNSDIFTAIDTDAVAKHLPFVVHITGAPDNTVTWQATT